MDIRAYDKLMAMTAEKGKSHSRQKRWSYM